MCTMPVEIVLVKARSCNNSPLNAVPHKTIMAEQQFDAHFDTLAEDDLDLDLICELLTKVELEEQAKLQRLLPDSMSDIG